ncbi:MAG: hypothetical protein AAGD96_32265, partial [Chloroflexota bacterium]
MPDGYSEHASIRIIAEGTVIYEGECDVFIESIVTARRHNTGYVGFFIDEETVPGLSDINELSVTDAASGFVIYRRLDQSKLIDKRVFRLETQFVPLTALDRTLKPYFKYFLPNVEMY